MSLFSELKRRNVFRVSVAYIVSAWLLAQVADLVLDAIGAPDWVLQTILLVLALGLAPVVFFSWAFEVTPEGIKRESEVDREKSITNVTARKLDKTITFVLVLAVAYFAVDKFVLSPPRVTPADGGVTDTDTVATDAELSPTIAVLPFVNMSEDESNEYFSDGLSEELLNVLARNPALQVAARTSSFSLKGEKLSIEEVARRLKVAHVLEGSVRKAGDQVRITAQLIRADNGFHLWSDTYDRNLDNIFAVQDEIANKITAALLPRIVGEDPAAEGVAYTPPAEAYQDYLLARNHWNKLTVVDMEKAYGILRELVRNHPDYAEAQALFARVTYANTRRTGGEMPWIVAEEQIRRALEKASAVNPDLPEIYLVEGLLHARSREPEKAIEFYEKAIELNPSYAEAWRYLSQAADDSGQDEQAWEALQKARELDPISVSTLAWVIRQATNKNKDDIAAEARQVLSLVAPESAEDVWVHVLDEHDRIAEAAIALEDFRAKWPDANGHDDTLGRLYARLGLIDEAMQLDASIRPILYAQLGQRELALAAMEEEAANRTDPHDRADAYWITYLTLGMKEEATRVLSDLWYGYAAEDIGPRMDFMDVFALIQLLMDAGRNSEAEPIARLYLENEMAQTRGWGPFVRMLEGDRDGAMAELLNQAERGKFHVTLTRIKPTLFALESHPDYARLQDMYDAWRNDQRALYDRLTAARTSPKGVAHP